MATGGPHCFPAGWVPSQGCQGLRPVYGGIAETATTLGTVGRQPCQGDKSIGRPERPRFPGRALFSRAKPWEAGQGTMPADQLEKWARGFLCPNSLWSRADSRRASVSESPLDRVPLSNPGAQALSQDSWPCQRGDMTGGGPGMSSGTPRHWTNFLVRAPSGFSSSGTPNPDSLSFFFFFPFL